MSTSERNSITNNTIDEIEHQLRQFQTEFDKEFSDPNAIPNFSTIEKNLENLMSTTRKSYLEAVSQYLSTVDEKEVIKQKKENTEEGG